VSTVDGARRLEVTPVARGADVALAPGAVRYRALDADLDWIVRYRPAEADPAAPQCYREVFACLPLEGGRERLERDTLSPHLLAVELTVPREPLGAEWNEWYHAVHMPSVVDQMPGAEVSRRFAPLGEDRGRPYVVLYEFASREELWDWQVSSAVATRRDEYVARWGVRNVRHAFSADPR